MAPLLFKCILCMLATCMPFIVQALDLSVAAQDITKLNTTYAVFQNSTSWKLLILYSSLDNKEILGATIAPEQKLLLPEVLKISSIRIQPSGRIWSKTQLLTPENIRDLSDFPANFGNNHLHITISCRKILGINNHAGSFLYTFKTISKNELLDLLVNPNMTLSKAFPDVQAAVDKGEIPFPRHFLGLPHESASINYKQSVEAAFERLSSQWAYGVTSNKEFVLIVLDILYRAYVHLRTKQNLLEQPSTRSILNTGLSLSLQGRIKGTDAAAISKAYESARQELQAQTTPETALLAKCLEEEYGLIMIKNNLEAPIISSSPKKE